MAGCVRSAQELRYHTGRYKRTVADRNNYSQMVVCQFVLAVSLVCSFLWCMDVYIGRQNSLK